MATQSPPEPQASDYPQDICFDEEVATLKCHPATNIVASGLMSGDIVLHSFSNTKCEEKLRIKFQKRACRGLTFSSDGRRLFSISKDKTLICVDSETGRLKRRIKAAHEAPIYSLALSGDYFVATGDDDGILKIWDIRSKECVMEFKDCDDFISDMIAEDKKMIIASSGEGTLTSFNLRRKRMELQSELFDAELLCLASMKRGEKLMCGSSDGVVNIFNWGQFGNISDRLPCGDVQIDSMEPVTENVLCVGNTDGFIKAVHMLPNRILGTVGQHDEGLPVEALSLSSDGNLLASCSHDMKVKFWGVDELKHQKVDTSKSGTKLARKKCVKFGKAKTENFFSGLAADDANNSDDDDDSDDDVDDDSDDDSD